MENAEKGNEKQKKGGGEEEEGEGGNPEVPKKSKNKANGFFCANGSKVAWSGHQIRLRPLGSEKARYLAPDSARSSKSRREREHG